ncbi:hypothetical protein HYQ45_016943 [Verticillium longisporum]|uniref:Uncharacterized protein n=3 Tax=Verticillium TaxID=1036719 RepID=A0A8I3AG31_VERLO|nr:hypothetical protein VdG2_00790 [Verticillium dahliae VDG2]KAG7113142.1 hypothetical protein HYQ45_016943 [Verticillium longisporum]KAH6707294.1 hypothetical protein EV126DRAFT_439496 [Verticillium dahliae]PNH30266.1 hypothetical protein BJF96_g6339 [Verticillium dahliae]PNH48510.1 hypothetical protein VD0003_g8618 [Verticillium dahliae]
MYALALSALLPLASAGLIKRCTPISDPDVAGGVIPPAPCWLTFNAACERFIAPDTELTIDETHNLIVVHGISEECVADIEEEHARKADGRKTFGWTEEHGKLHPIGGGILVISDVADETIQQYQSLTLEGEAPTAPEGEAPAEAAEPVVGQGEPEGEAAAAAPPAPAM